MIMPDNRGRPRNWSAEFCAMYGSDKTGHAFPGMDDQGSTSSWYVFGALGFFAVNPARPEYLIGSPVFDRATIHLGGGRDFVIVARNNSAEERLYPVREAERPAVAETVVQPCGHRRGRPLFLMGSAPNKKWAALPQTPRPPCPAEPGIRPGRALGLFSNEARRRPKSAR